MYGIVITEKGLELDAKLRAGNQLKLTRVMVGDGTVPEDTNPRKLTDLVSPFAEAASTAPVAVGASTMLVVEYRNDMNGGLDQDRYINEYGIWALDPNEGEILYLYGNLGEFREPVRAYKANDPVVTRRYPVSITVTDGVDVALGYLPTVFMTEAEARALIDAHNIDLTAHPDIRPITGEGAPTPETAGRLGQHYLDTNAGKEYVCIAADEETGVYTWKESGGGAAKNVSYDNEKSGLTASNVQDAIDEIAKGGGSGGSVLKITFAAAFAGHQYTVTDGDDTITGTVPKGLVASVSVINCDSTYTITTEVDSGDRYCGDRFLPPVSGERLCAQSGQYPAKSG